MSAGPWDEVNSDVDYEGPELASWDVMAMWHVMPAWEYQHPDGFRFRAFVGASGNFAQSVSNDTCGTCNNGRKVVVGATTGISVGFAFQ